MIKVDISPGELLDKITILEIKAERLEDEVKLENVKRELGMLEEILERHVEMTSSVRELYEDLKRVNEALWKIEDDIRDKERQKNFGDDFVALARSVYIRNDERCDLKRRINLALGSSIMEEKGYAAY